jgi:molybdenum cofactor guanylyltransferase
MGRDKAFVTIDGEPLVTRQLRVLKEAGAAELFVVTRSDGPRIHGSQTPPPGQFGAKWICDHRADAGPLAGIEAALVSATNPMVLVLAVDLPGMTMKWLGQLIGRAEQGTGVVPRTRRGWEPLAAIYPRTCLPVVRGHLDADRYALQALAEAGIREGWLEPWDFPDAEPPELLNWNRPEDWRPGES